MEKPSGPAVTWGSGEGLTSAWRGVSSTGTAPVGTPMVGAAGCAEGGGGGGVATGASAGGGGGRGGAAGASCAQTGAATAHPTRAIATDFFLQARCFKVPPSLLAAAFTIHPLGRNERTVGSPGGHVPGSDTARQRGENGPAPHPGIRWGALPRPTHKDTSFPMAALDLKTDATPRSLHRHLYVQVLVAIALGALIGHFFPSTGAALKPLGDAFIKLVKMIIAPVIFLTVVTGIAGMRDLQQGRPGRRQGLRLLPHLLDAGAGRRPDRRQCRPARRRHEHRPGHARSPAAVATYAAKAHDQTIVGFLLNIIPTTVVGAFAEGDILQVLFFSILFGVALALVGDKGRAGARLPPVAQRRRSSGWSPS